MSDPYSHTDLARRREIERFDQATLQQYQQERLAKLLTHILPENSFYAGKFQGQNSAGSAWQAPEQLAQLKDLPFTTKHELVDGGKGGFAANLTYPLNAYCRFHRTSGTKGNPMIVLDTQDDWRWWMEVWQYVLDSADMTADDRVVMAFSFGPFIGFWSAFDAAVERGAMVVPTGAMSSIARLEIIRSIDATLVFCTPSYAIHLAEIAQQQSIDLASTGVTRIIVAGEPGGSIPSVKDKIESAWGAEVIDHSGASEVGPWGYADRQRAGIHVNEAEFIAEFIPIEDLETKNGQAVALLRPAEGKLHELVLTCLGRFGSPVIRYRTGDLVRPKWSIENECKFVLLEGGVLGRTDDMMIIRGVNVFPTSIEQILRSFPDIAEFRMTAYKQGAMDQLKIEVEDRAGDLSSIVQKLQVQLGFRVEVEAVEAGALPRFEAKGKRFVDNR